MRITVKIGSNVLTRTDGSLDVTRMSALVDQVAALRKQGIEVLMVSSGAMASGRSELKDMVNGKMDAVDQRQLFSAVGQAKLINRYYEMFRDHGIPVGQVLTMKENFGTRRHYLNQRNCISVMLDNGVLPIINENDTISVTELMFTDNDELSGLIATMMDCDALVILSNIDGVFTGNPNDPNSALINQVEPGKDISEYISTVKSGFGRGGDADQEQHRTESGDGGNKGHHRQRKTREHTDATNPGIQRRKGRMSMHRIPAGRQRCVEREEMDRSQRRILQGSHIPQQRGIGENTGRTGRKHTAHRHYAGGRPI